MRRTFKLEIVLLMMLLSTGLLSAQEIWILAQGGRSSYGALYLGSLAGAGGDQNWKSGPIFGAGIRLKTAGSFSIDGTIEYSSHPFDPPGWSPVKDDPHNKIVDANAVGRLNFGFIGPLSGSFSLGAGYWYQKKDPIEYDSPYHGIPKEVTSSGVGLVLGLGLGLGLAKGVEMYLDGNIRGRTYVTPVLQLGFAYRVH